MYFNLFLYLFTRSTILTAAKTKIIFILVKNSNMQGDLHHGVLEHQPVPSRLRVVICPQG